MYSADVFCSSAEAIHYYHPIIISSGLGLLLTSVRLSPPFPLQSLFYALSITHRHVVSRSLLFPWWQAPRYKGLLYFYSSLYCLPLSVQADPYCRGWAVLVLSGEGDAFMQNNGCDFDLMMPIQKHTVSCA